MPVDDEAAPLVVGVRKPHDLAQREAGAAILLISEELEELLSLSDRVAVIYEGRLMGEVTDPDIDTVGLMMTGTPLDQIEAQKAIGAEKHG